MRGTFRLAAGAAAVITLAGVAAADAATVDLGTRNPRHGGTSQPTRIVSTTASYAIAATDTGTGGAAAFACKAAALNLPCLRSINSSSGTAFTFQTNGNLGGVIRVGAGGPNAKPFTTNATGVATGLNADMLDGKEAADFLPATAASGFLTKDAASNFLTKDAASNFLPASAASNFLGVAAKAADSDKLDGIDSTGFVPATRIALAPRTDLDPGDASDLLSIGGITLRAACSNPGGDTTIDLSVDTDQDDTQVATTASTGNDNVAVSSAGGFQSVFTTSASNAFGMNPVTFAIWKPDGTVLTGVIAVGLNRPGSIFCTVGGSLTRAS